MFGRVYTITNVLNGKQYVGQTIQEPHKRWEWHAKYFNKKYTHKSALYNAMKKYGIQNFEFRIIDTDNDIHTLNEKETLWIQKLGTLVPNGYNFELGGKNSSVNEITKQRMSIAHKQNSEKYSRMRRQNYYVVRSPDGREFVPTTSLNDFCLRNNLSASNMYLMSQCWNNNKKIYPQKGWMCCLNNDYLRLKKENKFVLPSTYNKKKIVDGRRYVIITPGQQVVSPTIGLAKWCVQHGLNHGYATHLRKMADNGGSFRRSTHKCYKQEDYIRKFCHV